MTAPAGISQARQERTFKALKAAGVEKARVIFDYNKNTAEVIFGETEEAPALVKSTLDRFLTKS